MSWLEWLGRLRQVGAWSAVSWILCLDRPHLRSIHFYLHPYWGKLIWGGQISNYGVSLRINRELGFSKLFLPPFDGLVILFLDLLVLMELLMPPHLSHERYDFFVVFHLLALHLFTGFEMLMQPSLAFCLWQLAVVPKNNVKVQLGVLLFNLGVLNYLTRNGVGCQVLMNCNRKCLLLFADFN